MHTEVARTLEVPHGATLVLAPRATDATWLNINRPVFAYRELKVILWCDAGTSLALAQQAVDFFDWISHQVECPSRPPRYAVEGLRCALAARSPGIEWLGGDLDACFAAARPRGTLHRVDASLPYSELVAEVRRHPRHWLAWTGIEDVPRLRRVRWAMAEAGRRTRAILVEPTVSSPGWRKVHARSVDLWSVREQLARTEARFPGRLGALTDLEPEAVDLLERLLRQGLDEPTLEKELLGAGDPGAVLGRLVLEREAAPGKALVREHAPIPMVRGAGRGLLSLRKAEVDDISTRLEKASPVDPEDVAWWAAWSTSPASIDQLMELSPVIRAHGAEPLLRSHQRTATTWNLLARVANAAGEADVARAWSEQALRASQSQPRETTSALHQLARALEAQGRYEEAEAFLRRDLDLVEKDLGPNHPSYGTSLQALASVLKSQGKYTEAEALARRSLAIYEKALGTDHPSYGASLHALASVLDFQGKYEEAEALLRRALAIYEKALGTDHPSYGASLHTLAGVLERQGKYSEAEALLRRSLAIGEKALGTDHPSYSASLHALASVLEDQGKYSEAEVLLRRSLTLKEKTLGTDHPSYGTSLHALAGVLERQGKYSEAEVLLRRSLTLKEKTLGTNHPSYGSSLHVLAGVLERQGKYQEAETLLHRSLTLKEKALGTDHPSYGASLHALAGLQERQGKSQEAETLLRRSLAIGEKTLGTNHPSLCPTLVNLGVVLANQNRSADGLAFIERARHIAVATHGHTHPEVAQVLGTLAQLQSITQHPGAPTTAREALEMLTRTLGPEHPITQEAEPVLSAIAAGKQIT